jgi:hypothetical protein
MCRRDLQADTVGMKNILTSIQLPSPFVSAARFVLHFVEMCVAMLVGMGVFMAVPGVMQWPTMLHQLGMAVAMTVPMVAWMKLRGHGWQHGIEMSLGMLLPWVAVLALIGVGMADVLPWLTMAEGPAMLLGMLAVMLLRPSHYAAGHHHRTHGTATEGL